MTTLRALSALLLFWTVCSGPQATQWLAEQDQTLTGKVFSDHVLFATDDVSGGSLLGCARICSTAKDCVSFTFSQNATSCDVCRGHTSTVTSFASHAISALARLYHAKEISDWVNKTCRNDHDCPVHNTECIDGLCLCLKGFYYSWRHNLCVPTCEAANLLSTFSTYPKIGLVVPSIEKVHGIPLEECLQRCTANRACRSVNHKHFSPRICKILRYTLLDAPQPYILDPLWNFYQRDCA